MKEKNRMKDVIYFILIIVLIIIISKVYKKYNFNDFYKAEYNKGISDFTRDEKEKCSVDRSYKIESKEFNDACFYKEIEVEANTPYRISCMVKTNNIQTENGKNDSGAQIFLVETTEHSEILTGTNEWQNLEFMVNSKSETTLKIGFRLGGDENNCSGTAWFSNFKVEKGSSSTSTNWKMACFILKNINVTIGKNKAEISMSLSDIETMKQNMERFKIAAKELSGDIMDVDYDIYEINEPITSVTYSEEYGYYVGPDDTKNLISSYLKNDEYDYIFTVVRLGNEKENIEIPTYDWIGLGGMDLIGIGYSNIRLPNSSKNYVYTYDYRINIFPEEVFIHEFLHTLERLSYESGYDRPELHSYANYGYSEKNLIGLKEWYRDYMQCRILNSDGKYIGINSDVYKFRPAHKKNFNYAIEIEFNKEPQNFIEEVRNIFKKIIGTNKQEEKQ